MMTGLLSPEAAAGRVFDLLIERGAALRSGGTTFWAWPRQDRIVIVFDPAMIDLARVDDKFSNALSTRLMGRKVKRTNTRGLFLQIGYELPSLPAGTMALDLSKQPTPLSLPLGTTERGTLWIPLTDMVSALVAGATGMGKSRLVHGWIQALLTGGETVVHAWDGKGGTEFARYIAEPDFHLVTDLRATMTELLAEAKRRRQLMLRSGATNLLEHNAGGGEYLRPIAFVIDEARFVPTDVRPMVAEIVEKERASGIHPILATNNPVQAELLVKTNLVTRISFRVPSHGASMMALGMTGAERLDGRGRGIIVWRGKPIEFTSYDVNLPRPSEEAIALTVQLAEEQVDTAEAADEFTRLAESIRDRWSPGMSKRKTAELFGKAYAGAFAAKVDRIIDILTATTTTPHMFGADFGNNQAVAE